MNNILIYAILGVAIGILVYMFSCEIKKTFLISKYNNYVAKFGGTINEIVDGVPISELITKNENCTETIKKIELAIKTIKKKYETEKSGQLETLKQCNSTVTAKMATLQKYLDKTVSGMTADMYMKQLDRDFDRTKFQ